MMSIGELAISLDCAVVNRSVLYDEEGATRMQQIVNYLVRYRIIRRWGARRTLIERKYWRRLCLSSGSMGFPTRAYRSWSEPRASTSRVCIQSSGTRKIFLLHAFGTISRARRRGGFSLRNLWAGITWIHFSNMDLSTRGNRRDAFPLTPCGGSPSFLPILIRSSHIPH